MKVWFSLMIYYHQLLKKITLRGQQMLFLFIYKPNRHLIKGNN